MLNLESGKGKRAWLAGMLGAYILLQFSWWAWLLIRQHQKIDALEGSGISSRATWMILGEGAVFLGLLTWGFIVILRGIKRERDQALKERHFMLAVTHELKTPIAGTQLAIDTLKKHDWDEETQSELLQDATAGLRRLEQRVENILQNNRIVSGKGMVLEPFDVESTMKKVVAQFQIGAFRERNIEVKQPNEVMGLVEGDVDALELAWGNLLENALKYSPAHESLIIEISHHQNQLRCTFDDGGPGIPKKYRAVVLKKFERLQDTDSSGTGLGLYLANQIIRMHGGQLTIASSSRGGCLITTDIPFNS